MLAVLDAEEHVGGPMIPKYGERQEIVDLRGRDWTAWSIDERVTSPEDARRLRAAIRALGDPAVDDATYRVVNFGRGVTHKSRLKHREMAWLMCAFTAAVALGQLPDFHD